MRICIIGPQYSGKITSGVNTFNIFLAQSLLKMGHEVELAVPAALDFEAAQYIAEIKCRAFCLESAFTAETHIDFLENRIAAPLSQALLRYDQVILSSAGLAYGRILRAVAGRPALVWTHGQQISPFQRWNGAELNLSGVKLVCINEMHRLEAYARGYGVQTVAVDMPVPFEPREVQLAGGFCVSVGNLEDRKNYPLISKFAEGLNQKIRVFGGVIHEQTREIINGSKYLEYRGTVPHEKVLDEIAEADFLLHAAVMEGRPMAVLEAMALGVPVIVPDIPLYREFVNPERNVLLGPKESLAKQLAKVDLQTLRGVENRRALSAETHERYGAEVFRERLARLLNPSEERP